MGEKRCGTNYTPAFGVEGVDQDTLRVDNTRTVEDYVDLEQFAPEE